MGQEKGVVKGNSLFPKRRQLTREPRLLSDRAATAIGTRWVGTGELDGASLCLNGFDNSPQRRMVRLLHVNSMNVVTLTTPNTS